MEMFVTSYNGMQIDANMFEEREGILANNSEALTDFINEATSGILFKNENGSTGFKGVFPKQKQ